MKKLVATVLSFQLIISPVALAAGTGTGDQFRENSSAKSGGADFYAKQILSLSTSAVGSSILTSCTFGSTVTSLKVFMAGSLAHIASEVLGGKTINEMHNKKASEVKMVAEKMKQGGDLQKATIEVALNEEKEILKFIKKRKTYMMAISAIYTAATALSIMETIKWANPLTREPTRPMWFGGCTPSNLGMVQKLALTAAYGWGAGKIGSSNNTTMYAGFALGLAKMIPSVNAAGISSYNLPIPRTITFGVSTALAATIMQGLSSRQKVFEGNVEKLEKLLASFNDETSPTGGLTEDGAGDLANNSANGNAAAGSIAGGSAKNYALKSLAEAEKLAPSCWSNTKEGMEFSEAACSKEKVTLVAPQYKADMQVPTLASASLMATELANAISAGDSAKADAAASKMAAMAGRLDQVKKNLEKQMNDSLVAQGEKPVDLDKEVNEQVNSLMNDLQKHSQSSNPNVASTSDLNGDTKLLSEDKKAEEEVSSINQANANKTVAHSENISFPTISEGIVTEEEAAADLLNEGAQGTLTEALGKYESTESDISRKSDVSIFKQVSNRYILNYPRFFERKEVKVDNP